MKKFSPIDHQGIADTNGPLIVEDENANPLAVSKLDFQGAGVSVAAGAADEAIVTIAGGGSGGTGPAPVRVSSALNPTTLSGSPIVDGVQTVAGDRVLVRWNGPATQNGIYVTTANPRTNLCPNPSAEVDVTGWSQIYSPTGSPINRSTAQAYVGSACVAQTSDGVDGPSSQGPRISVPVTAGVTYTASAYARAATVGVSAQVMLQWRDSGGGFMTPSAGTAFNDTTTGWTRGSCTAVAPPGAVTAYAQVLFTNMKGQTHYVDAMLVEASATVGDYFDGSTTDVPPIDYSWTGTAHNSASAASGGGAWVRASDADTPAKMQKGTKVLVQEGNADKYKVFTQTQPLTTLGTDNVEWRVDTYVDVAGSLQAPAALQDGHIWWDRNAKSLAAWEGGWTHLNGMRICTSTTRPGFPGDDACIYETDTGNSFIFQGGTWKPLMASTGGTGSVSPSYADSIVLGPTNFNISATSATNSGPTITFTSRGPTDVFLASFDLVGICTTAGAVVFGALAIDGVAWNDTIRTHASQQSQWWTASRTVRLTGIAAGTHTIGMRIWLTAGSGTIAAGDSTLTIARLAEGAADTTPIGTVQSWGGLSTVIPSGFLLCDGRAVSRTAYATLFATIGTAHGVGDGTTTFNLPNLSGRVPVGLNAADTEFNTIGKTGGEKAHVLTAAEQADMPVNDSGGYGQYPSGGGGFGGYIPPNANNTAAGNRFIADGGGGAHNNLQPYSTVCYIIKAFGSAAVDANPVQGVATATYTVGHVGFRSTAPYPLTAGRATITMASPGQVLIQAKTDISSLGSGYAIYYHRIGTDDSTLEQFFEATAIGRRQFCSTWMTWLPAGPTSLMLYVWSYAMPPAGCSINSTHWSVQSIGGLATLSNA